MIATDQPLGGLPQKAGTNSKKTSQVNISRSNKYPTKFHTEVPAKFPPFTTAIILGSDRNSFLYSDQVLLSAKNIQLESLNKHHMRKLQARFIGPFSIIKVILPVAYELDLPPNIRIHPVFHVSLLKPYNDPGEIPNRPTPRNPPPNVRIDDHDEFEVERILDKWRR